MSEWLSPTEKVWDLRFGKRLQVLRLREGLTMEDMGAALDITWQMYQKYEKGKARVPANRIALLARVLRVRVDALLALGVVKWDGE